MKTSRSGSIDIVEKKYWNNNWSTAELAQPIDISPGLFKNPQRRRLHRLFQKYLSTFQAGARLLEVGCANSYWLPYFATEYGFAVTGLDYSEKGCEQARLILTREGIAGDIICSDIFSPPETIRRSFDIVISFGVIEHFKSTSQILCALKRVLRPGGIIITLVPNLKGLVGFMQKMVNERIYDLHLPLTKEDLFAAHDESEFDCLFCDYYSFANFYVINYGDTGRGVWFEVLKVLRFVSKGIWLLENAIHSLPSNRFCSPHVICIAKNTE